MAQLWGGRFTKDTNTMVKKYNDSLPFDHRLYRQDIRGSIVHATMLSKQGIISDDEMRKIIEGLGSILADIENGTLGFAGDYEDIHSFVEAHLIKRIGEAGKKLHTARSRNDQVALDMKMYVRDEVHDTDALLRHLLETILRIMEDNLDTIMPGFTHLQKAQPVTLAHYFGAYFEMFRRDRERLDFLTEHMDTCPLGSGALAGTTYPLDREFSAKELGFNAPTANSMDGVSDRDYLLEFLSFLSICQMHMSRFSEEIILWNSDEYRFVEIDDSYSTGSSIMPQKKNPDIAELVRGKSGRVYGSLLSLLVTMKSLPLSYNKDMQEDKEVSFDAIDTVKSNILLFDGMLQTIKFRKKVMEESAKKGFTNATDAADYLARKGIPFRDAHEIVGRLVLYCIRKNCYLDNLTIEEFRKFCDRFDADIYDAISLKTCVEKRMTVGAPGRVPMRRYIEKCREYLS